ncbi:hypothetical protein BZA77DRAFT_150321 [Pyronema omphalodes]|nr:hypothetical protein BZA77DRAFT_150321 [Pyronema omphalodes]
MASCGMAARATEKVYIHRRESCPSFSTSILLPFCFSVSVYSSFGSVARNIPSNRPIYLPPPPSLDGSRQKPLQSTALVCIPCIIRAALLTALNLLTAAFNGDERRLKRQKIFSCAVGYLRSFGSARIHKTLRVGRS